jgi:multiple antibiotic resistance protein
MDTTALISAFVTIFVVIDPIGLAPMFVALTKGADAAHRRMVALRACTIAVVTLALFGLFGESVLTFTGISMSAFRIAGGVLLFLTALDMLFERRTARRKGQKSNTDDPSVFPLATPLIAGPGAITTMILLTNQAKDPVGELMIYLVMASVVLLVLLFFLASGLIERALGATGTNVITRLLGMLLAALSVQFVLDGLASAGLQGGAG